ncbi:unnamed protein product [Camellia sinensis]
MTLWNAFKDEFENEKNMLGSSLGRSSTRLMLGEKNMLVVVKFVEVLLSLFGSAVS